MKRLGVTGVLLATTLVCVRVAPAAVMYQSLIDFSVTNHDAGERGLDLDADGSPEFLVFADIHHSGIAIQATRGFNGVGGNLALRLTPFNYSPGWPINGVINYEGFLLLAHVPEILIGRTPEQPYTAMRFDLDGQIHYAWLRYTFINLTTNPLDVRYRVDLHEVAFEMNANTAISAGQTPEPAILAWAIPVMLFVARKR